MDLVAFTKAQFQALDNLLTSILERLDLVPAQPITNAEIDEILEAANE